MNLHTDIPTHAQVDRLVENRHPVSVSVYIPTDPASDGSAERIEGVVDEVARRVWRFGGTVLAVRREDVPGGRPAAAILRYAFGS